MRILKREYFGIQRKIVANMTTESWQNIPHASFVYEPDVTELFDEYKKINRNRTGENKITFNTLMLKVIAEGLKAAPIMNAHLEFNKRFVTGKLDQIEEINISMPTILPDGKMMTINLQDFGTRSLENMTEYINDAKRRAEKTNLTEALYSVSIDNTMKNLKKGKLLQTICRLVGANFGNCKVSHLSGKAKKEYEAVSPEERLTISDLEQGTVTISNVGSVYRGQRGSITLLEIVPPQVAAFAVGAAQERPVVVTKENGSKDIETRLILPICIAFDHRALDFGDTVPFMQKLDEIFANPKVIRSWVSDRKNENKSSGLTVVA